MLVLTISLTAGLWRRCEAGDLSLPGGFHLAPSGWLVMRMHTPTRARVEPQGLPASSQPTLDTHWCPQCHHLADH